MLKMNIEKIKIIRSMLRQMHYDLYYQKINGYINYYINPWSSYKEVKYTLSHYDEEINLLFNILLLSETTDYNLAIKYFGYEFVDALVEVKFLNKKGTRLIGNGYSIVSYYDFYFVVDTYPDYPNSKKEQKVYMGADTYRLCSALPKQHISNLLDLCTGSGIQAIIESSYCDQVTAVEINKEVIPATIFNTILNDCENKIKIIESDLYNSLENEQFDLITANPPFVPIPEDIYFPAVGDGGEDGLNVLKRIISGLDKHLKIEGNCIIIGECLGTESEPYLLELIKKVLPNGYECKMFLQARNARRQYIENIMELYSRQIDRKVDRNLLLRKLEAMLENSNSNSYYMFTLFAKKIGQGRSRFKIIPNYSKWSAEVRPLLNQDVKTIKNGMDYIVKYEDKILGTIPIRIKRCLEECRGELTMDQIVQRYCNEEYSITRQLFESVCEALDKENCIST